uniref:Putative secreted peptide n=1 Tax=Anopheles braziliensis TaxID=58242 RepID=A0A2M3ZWB4_9DIPT
MEGTFVSLSTSSAAAQVATAAPGDVEDVGDATFSVVDRAILSPSVAVAAASAASTSVVLIASDDDDGEGDDAR